MFNVGEMTGWMENARPEMKDRRGKQTENAVWKRETINFLTLFIFVTLMFAWK